MALPVAGQPRGKHWVFTYFPPALAGETPHDTLSRVRPAYDPNQVQYLTCNPEVCPETGRGHWQGYVVFFAQVRRPRVQAALNTPNAHCELMRGTSEEAAAYARKEASRLGTVARIEEGIQPDPRVGPRQNGDLESAIAAIQAGARIRDLVELHPKAVVRSLRGLLFLQHHYQPVRGAPPEVECHFGPPGCGKTRYAYDRFGAEEVYNKDPDSRWWDGYDGHRCILLDEFDKRSQAPGHFFTLAQALKICDRYPISREVKGAAVSISSEMIVFTGNTEPHTWFGPMADLAPFWRRVTRIVDYN